MTNVNKNIKVTVICPVFNEEKYVAQCIETILNQDFPLEQLEFLIVDGMSTDKTREIVETYAQENSFITLLDNPHRYVPHALNKGIKYSRGDVIIRIDGHCEYPRNYISSLVKYLYQLDADNVGGVWETLPANQSSISKAIAIASSHVFGVGNSRHKIGANQIVETDTVPFGCYKREVFDKIGLFDEDLIRNQDDEFNARLINNGGKIYLIPEIKINYYARNNLSKMAAMYFQYGLFKPLVNKKLGKPATLRQFFPLFFVVGLIVGFILSFLSKYFLFIYLTILLLYSFIGLGIGIKSAVKNKTFSLICHIPITFFIIHISYGWGYFKGLMKLLLKTDFNVQSSR